MWLARLRRLGADQPDLCPHCGGDFVYPAHWHEPTETHQVVLLRCGQSGTWRKDTFADDTLDRFDRKLDEAARQIAEEADRLRREWRSTEADAFAAVLDRDLIDAGDLAS
jgi:hypothetical protein